MPRSRKDCPVPGCKAKRLLKLSNHLWQVHQLDGDQRREWLNTASRSEPFAKKELIQLLLKLILES